MCDRSVFINNLSKTASRLFPNDEGEVWLYGSRARGDAKDDSDWDLIILLKKGNDDDDAYLNFAYPFVELGWDFDQAVVPLLYTQSQWDKEKGTYFLNNVMQDRIRI